MSAVQGPEEEGVPERLGRYRLVRCINSGGMARVYEARRESLAGVAPRVAIKVILPEHKDDATFQQLFVNEARIGSQLQHQNLVQIQDFDRDGDCFFLVMEYVEGPTLRQITSACRKRGVHVPLGVIAEIGRQVCEGLFYAHSARAEDGTPLKLVHRDIKPSNLVLNPQGVVKVLDFGISKALIAAEKKGVVKGTWGYMAPEQAAAADVRAAADQWGVAAVLYELAMLQSLFPEKDPETLRDLMDLDEGARRANALGGAVGPLAPVLMRALQRDPAARYPDAHAMGAALARLIPEPVRAREALLSFLVGLGGDFAAGVPDAPRRSHSTMSRVHMPAEGLPVAVGGRKAVEIQAERPVQRSSSTGVSTGALFLGGILACAVGIALVVALPTGEPPPAPGPTPAPPSLPTPPEPVAAAPVAEPAPVVASASPAPVERSPGARAPEPAPVLPSPEPVAPSPEPEIEPRLAPEIRVTEIAPQPTVSAPAPTGTGLLTISSLPRSKVYVDDKFVRYTPLFEYEVPAGAHSVVLEADDGRKQRFRVDVAPGQEVRKIWHFDKGEWVEQ